MEEKDLSLQVRTADALNVESESNHENTPVETKRASVSRGGGSDGSAGGGGDVSPSERRVLVVGGGIGGITAALELASCGVKVTMLEEGPSIGGRMIQLDKTFPTLDCSTCTLSPKMVEVAQNPRIELLTMARIIGIKKPDSLSNSHSEREGVAGAPPIVGRGLMPVEGATPPSGGHARAQAEKAKPSELLRAEGVAPTALPVEGATRAPLNSNGFLVTIRKKPRFVDMKKCTSCGLCAEACVMKGRINNEFNMNLSKRAAIYVPFPQAVPQKFIVDGEQCIFLSKGKCKQSCLEACEVGAINFDEKETIIETYFDSIVLAPGFDLYDATEKREYGYGTLDGVVTGIEFERICSVTGPTGGEIVWKGKTPKRFYFVQCVGSRDRQSGARFCSRVCCMYTAKHASIVKDRVKDAEIYVSYIDVRAYGKGYEEFYKSTQESGAIYIRGIPGEIVKTDNGVLVRVEDMLSGEVREIETDLVVLATGVRPRKETEELCSIMSIERDEYGFIRTDSIHPSRTNVDGIFVCGMASGPKDVPDTVASGGEAAAQCMEYIRG